MRDFLVCLSVLYIFIFLTCVFLSKWIRVSQGTICCSFILFSLTLSILAYYVIPPYGWDLRRHFDLLEGIRNSHLSLKEFLFQTRTNIGGSAYTSLVAFNFIRYFIARLTDNNHMLPWLCVLADYLIISYIATDWVLENTEDGKVDFFSLMLCFSFYPFVHAVSGMRTALSVAIMGLGIYRYLYKRKGICGFIVLAVIAVTIHQVALIAVPFVFLARFRIGVRGIMFVFLASVLLERMTAFFSASGFRYLVRIAWLYNRYTSDNQYRAGRYNLYGDIILMCIMVIIYLLLQKDGDTIFLSQKHNEIYSFLIYYMCFVLGNIGNYDLVLRPSYLLGVFAPVLSFLIRKAEAKYVWNDKYLLGFLKIIMYGICMFVCYRHTEILVNGLKI